MCSRMMEISVHGPSAAMCSIDVKERTQVPIKTHELLSMRHGIANWTSQIQIMLSRQASLIID